MKWPWVSLSLALALQADIDALQADVEFERKRYDDLLSRYHMLKLQGASEPTPERATPAKPQEDPVMAAVNAACAGKDAKVRSAMLKQVANDKKAEMSDADIILRIQRGNRPAEELE